MKHQVVLLTCLALVAFVLAVMAQTQNELRNKYGPPDARGRYSARPGVAVSAKYKGQKLAQLRIEPSELGDANNSARVMASDVAETVLDELVPKDKRGKMGSKSVAEFGCNSVEYLDYRNLKLTTSRRCYEGGGGTYSITAEWKE